MSVSDRCSSQLSFCWLLFFFERRGSKNFHVAGRSASRSFARDKLRVLCPRFMSVSDRCSSHFSFCWLLFFFERRVQRTFTSQAERKPLLCPKYTVGLVFASVCGEGGAAFRWPRVRGNRCPERSAMKRYFLFDLDGTVADNGEGILKSAQYALDAFGIHNEPEERLRRFVGAAAARILYGGCTASPGSRPSRRWRSYREQLPGQGRLREPALTPGWGRCWSGCPQRAVVCLATSKPEVFARTILETRQVLPCFQVGGGRRAGRLPHRQGGGHPGRAGEAGASPQGAGRDDWR